MLQVEMIDTSSKAQVNRFVEFHYHLYKNCPQWVPPFYTDIKTMLNRNKHPFYEHSDADFFLATRDNEVVGRLAIMENKPFNKYHGTHKVQFYLFDTIDDVEAPKVLFERAFDWSKKRGLDEIVGPKGFSPFDGYGIQNEGFEHRQMMTVMNYNYAYYPKLMDNLEFEKEVDFFSCYAHTGDFVLPEKVKEIDRKVRQKGTFSVKNFKNKSELVSWSYRIGQAYNKSFINNWEYYPLTDNEIKFQMDSLMVIANPRLIKIIMHKDEIVGFLVAFPDISAALQRQGGHITPWGIVDMMLELKRTKWVSLDGVGILPEYQGFGGNALMYAEIEKTINDFGFEHAEETQMAETAVQVRKDMASLGVKPYKNHRVYHKKI
jgi:hypothetical protein